MSLKKVFHTAIRVSSWSHAVAIGSIALILSACTDYVDKYEGDYKDDYGDKEKFLEKMNTYDGSWAEVCASDEWVWCAATSEGKIMGKANNGESWTQFTDGSAKLNFTGKDENAYHFTTNLLPSDVSSIVRENGGIKIELVDGEGSDAGIQLQVGHLGSYSEISVLTVKTGGTKPFISLRNVNENGDVVSEWRFYLYTTEGESVQTVTFTEFTHVSGNSDLADFIKNEVNTVAIGNSTVNNSLRVVALKFGGVPFDVLSIIASSSSNKGETAKSCSSNNGGSTAKSSSSSANTVWSITCQGNTSNNKINWGPIYYFFSEADKQNAKYSWTLNGAKTTVSTDRTPVALYSENGTYTSELAVTLNGVTKTTKCSAEITGITATSSSTAKSSSSVTPDTPVGFLWDGSNKSDFVKTDFGSGNKWYIFTDADTDSGSTYVSVPEINPYDVCLGKCIGVKFGEPVGNNERQPYAGVGFDLGEGGATYDVSEWQGICIAYQSIITSHSSAELRVDLRPYDPDYYGYNIPAHTLPVNVTGLGADYHIENILWSEFAQRWNDTDELSGTDVAAMLRGISISLESDPNTVAFFNVYQIGSYGRCGQVKATSVDMTQFPFPESSSSAESSSSGENPQVTCANDDLWCGPQGIYKVLTGLDAGDETSGYWFSYADDANGGNSRIDWPVERGNLYSPDAFDPVVDYCGGICGTYTLDKGTLDYDPDVGVGFSIAGTKDGSSKQVAADASGWGGVCITYTADNAAKLIMDLGDAKNAELASDKPFVTLGKTTVPQEKCFTWSQFKQGGWGVANGGSTVSGDAASKILVYLNFEIQAKTGTTGGFNIVRVRKYPEGISWGTCSADKETVNVGENIEFTFTPNLAGSHTALEYAQAAYYWDFGDYANLAGNGLTSPTKAYFEAGTYDVSVEVVMPDDSRRTIQCSSTITVEGELNPAWEYLNPAIEYGEFTDERDGQVYKTVVIGKQVWMAQNLNYAYLAGTAELDSSSFCYNNDPDSCAKYGRSYLWSAAMDSSMVFSTTTGIGCGYYDTCSVVVPYQGICPAGWRLPSKNDWEILFNYVGDGENVGSVLKTKTGWGLILGDSYNSYNGTDDYGFSANPTAYRGGNGKYGIEADAYFWSSHQDHHTVWLRGGNNRLSVSYNGASPNEAISVRCVHDLVEKPLSGSFIDERDGRTYNFVKIGNQTWMAQNLNYATENRRCYAGLDDTASCNLYGGLYTWADAVGYSDDECGYGYNCEFESQIQGICPNGWHMPSRAEFATLAEDVGGYGGLMLKSTTGWHYWDEGYDGFDALGFNGIPTGVWTRGEYGKPDNMAYTAVYWAATETNAYEARYMLLRDRSKSIELMYEYKDNYYSVRCVQDED